MFCFNKYFKNIGAFINLDYFSPFGLFYRLYRSIGEYDVLHGIFNSEIGTKQITQNALLEEARSDYSEAAKQYNEVKLISSKCQLLKHFCSLDGKTICFKI